VQRFFSQVAWDGAPTVTDLFGEEPQAQPPKILSKQLTVAEFFNRFQWEGTPEIAAPMAPLDMQSAPPEVETFTLDDFSDLF
jgi:hypothetical protein